MLCNLLLRTDRNRFEPSVVALIDNLTVAGPILQAGIPIKTMGMKPGIPDPRGLIRLARHLHRCRPAIVQTWMDHSNLIGGLAARLACRARVLWGVHHSNHDHSKPSTIRTVGLCAKLSRRLPAQVVCCSRHSRMLYAKRGFAEEKLTVIPNGFDTQLFRPDPQARQLLRQELGLGSETPLIGLVARYDPVKDHASFLDAAAHLGRRRSEVHFLLCGNKVDTANTALTSQIESLGLANRCHLLGPRRDVAIVQAALDIAVSSSISEAFPLTLGEAMSCGVPCVATDVGDSAFIIGETGRIVPPRDPAALADAWNELLAMQPQQRERLGTGARDRVCRLFDLTAVTRQYEALYERLANEDSGNESATESVDDSEQQAALMS